MVFAPLNTCPLELGKRGQQALHPQPVHVDELPRQQRAAVLRRDGGREDHHDLITNDSKKTNKVGGAVGSLADARNPLAYHSDYFGACAVGADAAPRPSCAAARPIDPGSRRRVRRRFTRLGGWARAKKSAAGPATALVGAPCNKRVLRGWSRLFAC